MIHLRIHHESWPVEARKQPPLVLPFYPFSGGPVCGGALVLPWWGQRTRQWGVNLRPVLFVELEW